MLRTTRLGLEALEVRENPAITVVSGDISMGISSDDAGDTVRVQNAGTHQIRVQTYAHGQWSTYGVYAGAMQIVFEGKGGNDRFTNSAGRLLVAYGGAGNDVLRGGDSIDILVGGIENDTMYGGEGDDSLHGGLGDDAMYGEADNDTVTDYDYQPNLLIGQPASGGVNILSGGEGFDRLYGGDGKDTCDGGRDGIRDTVVGGSEADRFVKEEIRGTLFGQVFVFNLDAPEDFNLREGDLEITPPIGFLPQ